jgi:hypothetical protein
VERLTEPHDATRESKRPIANVLPVLENGAIMFIVEHATLASMHDAMNAAEKNLEKSEVRDPIVRNLRTHSQFLIVNS